MKKILLSLILVLALGLPVYANTVGVSAKKEVNLNYAYELPFAEYKFAGGAIRT